MPPPLGSARAHATDGAGGTDTATGQSQKGWFEAAATPSLAHHPPTSLHSWRASPPTRTCAVPCASPHAAPRARVRIASWRTAAGGGAQLDLPLLYLSNLPPPAPRSSRAELRQGRRIERLAHAAVERLLEQLKPWLTQPPQYSFSIE
eukprot:scaffold72823_cov63-Phaeocystis_antarctica.AAC.4